MNKFRYALTICSLIIVSLTFTVSDTHAQTAQRTFVSTSGSDANTASLCGANNPCRGFAAALTVTTAGGEIIALTSGGYGTVEINKSVQITAPTGVYVAITAAPGNAIGGTDAIRVNAASGIVVIKGLTLNNVGLTNANGITFPAGNKLYVENCVINGFDNHGISVDRAATNSPEVFITDTVIRNGYRDFGSDFNDAGIFLRQTASGNVLRTTIDNCRLESAGKTGLLISDNTRTTVRNTIATRNDFGFATAVATGTTAELNLENCTVTLNDRVGIIVGNDGGGATTARLSNTVSANNGRSGILINSNGIAHISDSTFNGNSTVGVSLDSDAVAHISTSTINNNGSSGIELNNAATSRIFVTFTTISGNKAKGINRSGTLSQATTIGNNRIFNNSSGSDAFSASITQQ